MLFTEQNKREKLRKVLVFYYMQENNTMYTTRYVGKM